MRIVVAQATKPVAQLPIFPCLGRQQRLDHSEIKRHCQLAEPFENALQGWQRHASLGVHGGQNFADFVQFRIVPILPLQNLALTGQQKLQSEVLVGQCGRISLRDHATQHRVAERTLAEQFFVGGVRCIRQPIRDLLRVEIGSKDCIGILRIAVQHQRQRLDRRRKIGAPLPIRPELGRERCLGARFRIRPHPTQGLLHCVILTRS